MFLNDGKVVFLLLLYIYKFSRFTLCSCVSVCYGLFGCALFGCVVFPCSEVGGSFCLSCFCLLILMCQVLYYYLVDYLFSGAFLLLQRHKINISLLLSWLDLHVFDLIIIYKALCFDVAQGRMNGAPNETRTHSCRFASLAC